MNKIVYGLLGLVFCLCAASVHALPKDLNGSMESDISNIVVGVQRLALIAIKNPALRRALYEGAEYRALQKQVKAALIALSDIEGDLDDAELQRTMITAIECQEALREIKLIAPAA